MFAAFVDTQFVVSGRSAAIARQRAAEMVTYAGTTAADHLAGVVVVELSDDEAERLFRDHYSVAVARKRGKVVPFAA